MRKQEITVPLAKSIHDLVGKSWPKPETDKKWQSATAMEEPATVRVVLPSGKSFTFESTKTLIEQRGEVITCVTIGPMKTNGTTADVLATLEELRQNYLPLRNCADVAALISEWQSKKDPQRVAASCKLVNDDVTFAISIRQPDFPTIKWIWLDIYVTSLWLPASTLPQ
jgi:hypothetical protein